MGGEEHQRVDKDGGPYCRCELGGGGSQLSLRLGSERGDGRRTNNPDACLSDDCGAYGKSSCKWRVS